MDRSMRRLLIIECDGDRLGASLDEADGSTGILIVTGGTQTRIGSHRLFERLAAAFAEAGHPCLRFDRRGVGDSEGEDPDFRGNAHDIAAAATAFRAQVPGIRRLLGLGLCDGATSLALFGAQAGIDGLILINPWLVEAESDAPAPAAIKHHYRRQLTSLEGWKKILSGSISYRKLLSGILRIMRPQPAAPDLALQVAQALAAMRRPIELILAKDDATGVAALAAWRSKGFAAALRDVPVHTTILDTDAHTFSRPGDAAVLARACLDSIARSGGFH